MGRGWICKTGSSLNKFQKALPLFLCLGLLFCFKHPIFKSLFGNAFRGLRKPRSLTATLLNWRVLTYGSTLSSVIPVKCSSLSIFLKYSQAVSLSESTLHYGVVLSSMPAFSHIKHANFKNISPCCFCLVIKIYSVLKFCLPSPRQHGFPWHFV